MEFVQQVLQFTAILAGWIVVHKLSVRREIDKGRRELVAKVTDELVNDIRELYLQAKEYHTNTRNTELSENIKFSLQDIATRANLLHGSVLNLADLRVCTQAISNLRRAITGEHFEDAHDGPKKISDSQMYKINQAALRAQRVHFNLKLKQFSA
ncbi:hypothetical protein HSX11_03655 [Oxalobacteraceae bacterium]|nr:hypothetical protein [Oxalobacteraceae bacterium]